MRVRDGMSEIVVTVGPSHTLREAARRMTARNVGAAVVIDNDGQGPGIITGRDLLRSSGAGEDLDAELVRRSPLVGSDLRPRRLVARAGGGRDRDDSEGDPARRGSR